LRKVGRYLYIVFVILLFSFTFYLIFWSGHPKYLLKYLYSDRRYDIYVIVGFGFLTSLVAFFSSWSNENKGYMKLLEMNKDYIRKLRKRGKSDEEIAEALLKALGRKKGIGYGYEKRKIIYFLSKLK